ncbi:MAG: hypothetical protein NZM00_03395 [Anaerolinea sp.]|nr:hypothetical protein [Anaerolinea sp.]
MSDQPTPITPSTSETDADAAYRRLQATLDRYKPVLLAIPGVVGVGIGYATVGGQPTSELALIVMVEHKLAAQDVPPEARIPARINGVRVDVQEMGAFTAF